jgi:hypothetical protein
MSNDNANCACWTRMAERELSAFMSPVTELYGPAQARIAAEDWIDTFESMGEPFGFTTGEWRKITIGAASRLAARLVGSGQNATDLQ